MYKRLIAAKIRDALGFMPVVYLEGARQVGKTTLLRGITSGLASVGAERVDGPWAHYDLDVAGDLELISQDPRGLFRRQPDGGIVIDEVQRAPMAILAVKEDVDRRNAPGRFLLSGSANPHMLPQMPDSLAGRRISIGVSTLSENEVLGTEPSFLANLMAGRPPAGGLARKWDRLLDRVVVGCYPKALEFGSDFERVSWHRNYVSDLVHRDIKDTSGVLRAAEMERLVMACMASTSNAVNIDKLAKVVSMNQRTVKKYLSHLGAWFLVDQVEPWFSNELKRLSKRPKLHVLDTGLACSMLGLGKEALVRDYARFGKLAESFVYSELKKQASFLEDAHVSFFHFRDSHGHEVDIVIENARRECFAVEVKSGATVGRRDLRNMSKLREAAGDRFKMGVVLYDGDDTKPFGEDMYTAPLSALWA